MIGLRPKTSRGYTVIEVLIFLAVSGAILTSAMFLFHGSQGRTAFNVAVQDLNSEITTLLKETNTSVSQFPGQFDCSTSTGKPVVAPPANTDQGSNTGCVILGQAFKPIIGGSEIDVYSVVGCQIADCSGGDPTSLSQTKPTTPADPAYLKQAYRFDSATILSSKVSNGSSPDTTSNLVGFYTDLSGTPISGAATVLQAFGYSDFPQNGSDAAVKTCIEGSSCSIPAQISIWKMCVQSPYDSTKTVILTVTSNSKGVSTDLQYTGCS